MSCIAIIFQVLLPYLVQALPGVIFNQTVIGSVFVKLLKTMFHQLCAATLMMNCGDRGNKHTASFGIK